MNATVPFTLTADLKPPHNIECEEGVLGACLIDNAVIDEVSPYLKPERFFRDVHGEVWRIFRDLRSSGTGIDSAILKEHMGRRQIGADREIDDLIATILRVPFTVDAVYHAQIVKQLWTLRELEAATFAIRRDIHAKNMEPDRIVAAAQDRIFQIAGQDLQRQSSMIGPGVMESVGRVQRRREGASEGTSTGYRGLDHYLGGGLIPGRLIVIAARPAMGKTALGLNIAEKIAIDYRVPLLFFSVEMAGEEISDRVLFSRCKVASHIIREREKITDRHMANLEAMAEAIRDRPLAVNDTGGLTISDLMAETRRQHSRIGVKVVVIDYIQLVKADDGTGKESRQEQVASVVRGLKQLARELEIPVIALAQLNREADRREDHRPRLSDLRESGAIEQDADMVVFIHRPEYYDPNDSPGAAELIVSKNRHGPTGTIRLGFLSQFTRFEEYDPAEMDIPNF